MTPRDPAAYEQLEQIYRAGHNGIEGVIVAAGGHGTQYAATRLTRYAIQRRAWRVSDGTWTSWRKIMAGEIVRFATLEDEAHYQPDLATVLKPEVKP